MYIHKSVVLEVIYKKYCDTDSFLVISSNIGIPIICWYHNILQKQYYLLALTVVGSPDQVNFTYVLICPVEAANQITFNNVTT